MFRSLCTPSVALMLGIFATGAAAAQDAALPVSQDPVACPSQQELEQTIESGGDIRPEGCISIDVSKLSSDGTELCLIDFGVEEGFLGRLRDVAMPSQWWVDCAALDAALD